MSPRSGGTDPRSSRLMLIPGLRRLWRDRRTLQLGVDPRRAVVLEFAEPVVAHVVDLLDGARTESDVVAEAVTYGVPATAARGLVTSLRQAGLVVAAHTLVPKGLPEPARQRLANEIAALALRAYGDSARASPAQALRSRADARVLVSGDARLAAPIAQALAASGVGHVHAAVAGRVGPADPLLGGLSPADVGRGRSVAICDALDRVAPGVQTRPLRTRSASFTIHIGQSRPANLDALALEGVPHLSVRLRDGSALVGPMVEPHRSPCLNCVDLHRRDRDPAWPALAAQLAAGHDSADPCAATTIMIASARAAAEALDHIDGGHPITLGTTIEIGADGRERRRSWPPHPSCDCRRRRRSRTPSSGSHPALSRGR